MSQENRDGFNLSKYIDGRMCLSVESDRLDDCVKYCRRKKVPLLHISLWHGYKLDNLDLLAQCPHVTGVHLQHYEVDISGLHSLRDLSSLYINIDLGQDLDLAQFPHLAQLTTFCDLKHVIGLSKCRSLTQLQLHRFKPSSRDLDELSALRSLKSLRLVQSNILSLRGIERLRRLWEFEAHYCSRLRDIRPILDLKNAALRRLRLDRCKNIELRECVAGLDRLTHLSFGGNSPLPSIQFIRCMPGLLFFAFVGTDVIDGDMTPLLGLRYAGFESKRHFSHTFPQVQRALAERGGMGPWRWGSL